MRDQHLILATNWTIWPIVLFGAAAIETILSLYGLERRVVSRRLGLALAGLRVALLALVIGMLAQPVRPWTLDKTLQRYVAVLVDNSASMYVPDTQLVPSEKMRLAQRFSVGRRCRDLHGFDSAADDLDALQVGPGAAPAEWLASLGSAQPVRAAGGPAGPPRGAEQGLRWPPRRRPTIWWRPSPSPSTRNSQADARVRATADELPKRLAADVRDRLKEAVALTSKDNAANLDRDHARLLKAVSERVGRRWRLVGQGLRRGGRRSTRPSTPP